VLAELDPQDTIAAVASPPGPGVRGLVRLSGSNAWPIALAGFHAEEDDTPPRRPEIRRGSLQVEGLRPLLPALIALWPGPRTYTGQDVAEIHTVGAVPCLTQVLAGCLNRGARHAQPGEFTLRAFLSGRIDLTRAEAVLGVIDARNSAQLDAALRQLAGGVSRPILVLRDRLLDLVAHLEANLDFADESDVDPLGRAVLADELQSSGDELAALADRLTRRDRPAGNPRVVLSGPPNAGKSRLFNALLGHHQAIVSPRAGTTRDYLTATCDVGGMIVELIDTAGLDVPRNPIESQAQTHRADQAGQADLLLLCSSTDTQTAAGARPANDTPVLSIWTKCDLGRPEPGDARAAILTSAATGEGLDELRSAIARHLRGGNAEADSPASTGARCRDSLEGAATALGSAAQTLRDGGGEELVALDLRLALDELGKVVGAVVTDDILDRIFQRFCIGK
jgi:tRNA modification GTPase